MTKTSFLSVLLILLALFATALVIWGTLDIPRVAVFGYHADSSGLVLRVDPEGAAHAVDLREGDRIITLDGRPFGQEARRLSSWVHAGSARRLAVERQGRSLSIEMVARALPTGDQSMGVVTGFSSLIFIFGSLWIYLRSKSTPALALAAIGLSLGVAQGFRPVATSQPAYDLLAFGYQSIGALCVPILVHFALLFPRRRAAASSGLWLTVLYGPAVATITLDALGRLLPATAPTTARWADWLTLGGQSWLLFVAAWLILSVAGFVQTSAEQRRQRGLYVLVWGTAAAIVPILSAAIIQILAPEIDPSWLNFAFIPSLALPLVLGYSVWKSDKSSEETPYTSR